MRKQLFSMALTIMIFLTKEFQSFASSMNLTTLSYLLRHVMFTTLSTKSSNVCKLIVYGCLVMIFMSYTCFLNLGRRWVGPDMEKLCN